MLIALPVLLSGVHARYLCRTESTLTTELISIAFDYMPQTGQGEEPDSR